MNAKERAQKDIDKLAKALKKAKELHLDERVIKYAENYYKDAIYFFEKKDYFTSFASANYAYGLLDALFILKGIRERLLEEGI